MLLSKENPQYFVPHFGTTLSSPPNSKFISFLELCTTFDAAHIPDDNTLAEFAKETLKTLASQKIIHRDIKSANIVICGDHQQLKLTDFGLSCESTYVKILKVPLFI